MIIFLKKIKHFLLIILDRLTRFKNLPLKFIGHFLYWINFALVKLIYKKNNGNIPNLGSDYCKIKKISIDDNFLKEIHNDIKLNREMYYLNKSFKYCILKNKKKNSNKAPLMTADDNFKFIWGFNRVNYINFFKKNFDEDLKEIYHGANYRVEQIVVYKTNHFNGYRENRNTKYHSDNDVSGSVKILIYLCDVDENNGPFCYYSKIRKENIIVKGKIGNTIIFDNNNLMHSGSATINKDRLALTFSIVPTLREKIIYAKKKTRKYTFNFKLFYKI
jgi:hypothetical protein